MTELNVSTVHRNLDAKLTIGGMDAPDLILVALLASINNMIFGGTSLEPYLVFGLPLLLAVILFFGKRNKPDQFLVHFARYYITPGQFCAGETLNTEEKRRKRIYDKN